MSWLDRLRSDIELTSPSGAVFNPLWIGDDISMAKKLGIFEYPKVLGAVVQDMDVGATSYPLSLFFEGPDNDLEAADFFKACKERGPWTVIHPVDGTLILNLVNISKKVRPVESGNLTQVDTLTALQLIN
jgi:prophage DNA circulation protein